MSLLLLSNESKKKRQEQQELEDKNPKQRSAMNRFFATQKFWA